MDYIVTDNAFGGGKISDAHFDDPAFDIGDVVRAPLLAIPLHWNIFWFPVVIFHCAVEVVSPLVFERQDVKIHRLAAVYDLFSGKSGFGFITVEDESSASNSAGDGFH